MVKVLFFPVILLWKFIGMLFKLMGAVLTMIIGLVLVLVGVILTATIIGAPLGIVFIVLGGLMTLKAIF